jgi:hypothetical protein
MARKTKRLEYMRVGLRRNGASIKLRLRWDNSPDTCAVVSKALPVENQLWHAKYASSEIYMLVPVKKIFGRDPRPEWQCMYPAPGDFMWLFHPPGLIPGDISPPDKPVRIVDLAYFYARGTNLNGPWGANPGNIFATATSIEDIERFGKACHHVWFNGIAKERLYIEAA